MASGGQDFASQTVNSDDDEVNYTATPNRRPREQAWYQQLRSGVFTSTRLGFIDKQFAAPLNDVENAAGGTELGAAGDAYELCPQKTLVSTSQQSSFTREELELPHNTAVSENSFEPDVPLCNGLDVFDKIDVPDSNYAPIKIAVYLPPARYPTARFQASVTPLSSPRDLDNFEYGVDDNAAGGDCAMEGDDEDNELTPTMKTNEGGNGDTFQLCQLSIAGSNDNEDEVALYAHALNKMPTQVCLEKMKILERKYRPMSDYLPMQPELDAAQRSTLIEAFVGHANSNFMEHDTIYLCVHYLDVFLSRVPIKREEFRLVGCACFYLASSYENGPLFDNLDDFEPMLKEDHTRVQFREMRQKVIAQLKMDLTAATSFMFLSLYTYDLTLNQSVLHLAHYVCELTLLDLRYNKYYPSVVAAGALALARFNFKRKIWSGRLENATGYPLEKLQLVILELAKTYQADKESKKSAVRNKYNELRFDSIACAVPRKMDDTILLKEIARYCQRSRFSL